MISPKLADLAYLLGKAQGVDFNIVSVRGGRAVMNGVTASFAVMRWLGLIAAAALTENGYRPLRDTAPWKYVGFFFGDTLLVAALIGLVERRVSWRAILVGAGAAVVLIVVYDLPFDDLLLPPNGDV